MCGWQPIIVDFEDATSPWYFLFEQINNELAHTVENIEIICSFLQVGQDVQWNDQKVIDTFYHMQDSVDADYEYKIIQNSMILHKLCQVFYSRMLIFLFFYL